MTIDNMELGNLVFGNSRGEFSLERGKGFEEELIRLFDAVEPNRDTSWAEYGIDFENNTFSIFRYYWGDCSCGFDDADDFDEPHNPDCYQTKLKQEKLEAGWYFEGKDIGSPKEWGYKRLRNTEDTIYKKLTKKFGLPMQGCAVHCTCDHEKRYQNYMESKGYNLYGHKQTCLLVKPNFLYKPTGFSIKWYKYPLRDSYTNQKIILKEFKTIINNCIKSLKR